MNRRMRRAVSFDVTVLLAREVCGSCGDPICPACGVHVATCECCGDFNCPACGCYVTPPVPRAD